VGEVAGASIGAGEIVIEGEAGIGDARARWREGGCR